MTNPLQSPGTQHRRNAVVAAGLRSLDRVARSRFDLADVGCRAVAAAQQAWARTPLSSSATSVALLLASARSLQLTARTKGAARVRREPAAGRQGLLEWASANNSRRRRRR